MLELNYFIKEENFKGVFVVTDKNLKVVVANETFSRLQGYSQDELSGTPFTNLIVPEDKTRFFDMVYTNKSENEMTIQMYHKNGAFRFFRFNMFLSKDYVLLLGEPLKKEFKGYQYNSSLDMIFSSLDELDIDEITDIINGNDGDLATFMNIFPIDIWVKDRLGRYVFVNNVFSEHTGCLFDDVYMKDDYQVFSKTVANEFTTSDASAIKTKKRINYTFETEDESLRAAAEVTKIPIFNKQGKYIGIIGFSTDISSYKGVENILRKELDCYESILSKMDYLIFNINSKGILKYIGGNLVEKFDINTESLLNTNVINAHPSRKEINEKFGLVFQGKTVILETDVFGPNIEFTLHPSKKENGYSVIGIGKTVGDKNE